MRYMATVYISDVMDQIAAQIEVQGWSEQWGPPEEVMLETVVWPGIGEDDAAQWLRQALHAVWLHFMQNPPPVER